MLDSGPLGMACHPKPNADFARWLEAICEAGVTVMVPEIADYEIRRELLRNGLQKSVERLDSFKQSLVYRPINTNVMLRAARFWADARNRGVTTAHPAALDGDVILAAQAQEAGALVVTDNLGHLSQFVDARRWTEIR